MIQPKCPQCGGPLETVRQPVSAMLNSDQFDSIKAGDFFCRKCPDNDRGVTGLCYWWIRELENEDEDKSQTE